MKNFTIALLLSSLSLLSTMALATPASVKPASAFKAPAVLAKASFPVTMLELEKISRDVALLVRQQRLPEAIASWQSVVDSFSAPASTVKAARENKEHAITLRARAMLHRLNGDVHAALSDIELACKLDARDDLAKPSGQYNLIERVFDSASGALQTRAQSGNEPEQPLLAARNSEHIGEAFAAYGSFATAEFFYRNAFNLRLKIQGNAHAKTIQTAWRVIELTQMAGVKFTSEEREDIILDTNVKMDNEPAASIAPEGSKLNSMFVSPRQGELVFTVSEPVLRGQRQYEDSFCGSENVLGMPFADKNEPDNITYLKPNADGTLELQLLVRDGKDNPNYRFSNVRPGATTLASLEGNCALPRVKVSYTPTHSKLCLNARAINQPLVSIVRDLISVTGISVQGIELLGKEKMSFDAELTAHTILEFVASVAELELEPIDETHFAFHPKGAPQAYTFSTPEKLAARWQSALRAGDFEVALALGDFENADPSLKWAYLTGIVACAYATYCGVSVRADDAGAIVKRAVHQLNYEIEFQAQPLGVLMLSVVTARTDAYIGNISVPYTQVDGKYRLLARQYTAKKLTELRAQSNTRLLAELFALGIRENVPPYERRFDWKTAASVLAPGGGDVGAAYTAEVARDYLSYSTGDLAAVLADGGDVAQALYGDDRDPKSFRVLALRTEAVRMLTSIHVLGGYQLGDTVVLDTVGQTESGWIVRGPVILTRNSKGKFIRSGDRTVSYPE